MKRFRVQGWGFRVWGLEFRVYHCALSPRRRRVRSRRRVVTSVRRRYEGRCAGASIAAVAAADGLYGASVAIDAQ